jgi:hypothetical protein
MATAMSNEGSPQTITRDSAPRPVVGKRIGSLVQRAIAHREPAKAQRRGVWMRRRVTLKPLAWKSIVAKIRQLERSSHPLRSFLREAGCYRAGPKDRIRAPRVAFTHIRFFAVAGCGRLSDGVVSGCSPRTQGQR